MNFYCPKALCTCATTLISPSQTVKLHREKTNKRSYQPSAAPMRVQPVVATEVSSIITALMMAAANKAANKSVNAGRQAAAAAWPGDSSNDANSQTKWTPAKGNMCVCVCVYAVTLREPSSEHESPSSFTSLGLKSLSKVSLSLGEINERLCDLPERGLM